MEVIVRENASCSFLTPFLAANSHVDLDSKSIFTSGISAPSLAMEAKLRIMILR